MDFRGWIPTVTGRLSFEVIGDSKYPTQTSYVNVACKNHRYFICSQKRPLLDIVLPAKYIFGSAFMGLEGKLMFLCIGRSSNNIRVNNDSMIGSLFIIDIHHWRDTINKIIEEKMKMLSALNSDSTLHSVFDSEFEKIRSELPGSSYYCTDYILTRDGNLRLTIPSDIKLSENAPVLPENKEKKKHIEHMICSQMFFYLKDIIHSHQHHDPTTDTVLDVYPVENNDDYSWRCDVLRLLYRKVLQFKRSRREDIFCSALGTLAYIKSFREISEEVLNRNMDSVFIENGSKLLPEIKHENLKESIVASQSSLRNNIQDRISGLDLVRNTLIGIIGALVALVGLVQLTSFRINETMASNLLILLSKWLICEPVITLSIVCSIFIGLLMAFKVIKPLEWVWVRGLFKLLVSFNKLNAAIFCIISAFLILMIVFLFCLSGVALH